MFQPITDFTYGKYFADEAAYAKIFTDMGTSPFPAAKDPTKPTKTWSAPSGGTYRLGGFDKPGYLTVVEGSSIYVVDQPGRGDHQSWVTATVPPALGQLLTNFQHDFYVEYRHHDDYQQGIPLLAVSYEGMQPEWLAYMNFAPVGSQGRALPPISQGKLMNWGMRFRPGSTQKRLEDIEVFPIEAYRAKYRAPAVAPKPVGEYKYDDAAVAQLAMSTLFGEGTPAEKGRAIRAAAEARK